MSNISQLRRIRIFEGQKQGLDILPAFKREVKLIKIRDGLNIPVIVSHGQIINPRKAYKRLLKAHDEKRKTEKEQDLR